MYIKSVVDLYLEGLKSWITIEIVRLCTLGCCMSCLMSNHNLKIIEGQENKLLSTMTALSAVIFMLENMWESIWSIEKNNTLSVYKGIIVSIAYVFIRKNSVVSTNYLILLLLLLVLYIMLRLLLFIFAKQILHNIKCSE